MNYWQFGMLFLLIPSIFIMGNLAYVFIRDEEFFPLNRSVYLGETLLLGSTLFYGAFLLLSMFGLYTKYFLWGTVFLGYSGLFYSPIRKAISRFFNVGFPRHIACYGFLSLLLFFIFRNCYFLLDVDSHTTYLLTQKIWLLYKTSILNMDFLDVRNYIPQFDSIFYSLSIPFFPTETLFPQMINTFYRVIAVLLVYGYTAYRFNAWYGLAAAMFLLFNLHFYVSGANHWVLMNGAIIALFFGAAYNFYESRRNILSDRFLLGLIFLSQLPSNKYQSFYIFFFLLAVGMFIQPDLKNQIIKIISNKKKLFLGIFFVGISLLHYIKNWIAVGLPCFPVLAGTLHVMGRTPEFDAIFREFTRGITDKEFVKYFGFFFVWHGAKPLVVFVYLFITAPIYLLVAFCRKCDPVKMCEITYWLCVSLLGVFGISLATHQDPRYYIYVIGPAIFAVIYIYDFILKDLLCIKDKLGFIRYLVILKMAASKWKIMFWVGTTFLLAPIDSNIKVLTNKLHTMDVIDQYFPMQTMVMQASKNEPDKYNKSAWFYDQATGYSPFLLPLRPAISVWWTSTVKWNSFDKEDLIIKDLRDRGIQWVVNPVEKAETFETIEKFASQATHIDRRPLKTQMDYGFPPELTTVKYAK
ncbi:MAG: hypothetical protein HQL26_05970 [Candidatus Omnitrophica bacterium]|nr:hypothetical protein [Candidatus Omnitrophota bacterium]